jgi:hypothetical protein
VIMAVRTVSPAENDRIRLSGIRSMNTVPTMLTR